MAHTLAVPARHLLEVKGSRFLAQAFGADSPTAALDALRECAQADATHNCWAYRIGAEYRSSDDGEPAGTAGRPILAAIDGQGFDRVIVVVTRWYGGVKLGAGGLVRAYGGCAAECLRQAPRLELVETRDFVLRFGFADTGAVHALLGHAGVQRLEENFDAEGTSLHIRVQAPGVDALRAALRDATRDRARMDVLPQAPVPSG